eukprot:g10233.t1
MKVAFNSLVDRIADEFDDVHRNVQFKLQLCDRRSRDAELHVRSELLESKQQLEDRMREIVATTGVLTTASASSEIGEPRAPDRELEKMEIAALKGDMNAMQAEVRGRQTALQNEVAEKVVSLSTKLFEQKEILAESRTQQKEALAGVRGDVDKLASNVTQLGREFSHHRDEILASDAALREELASRLEKLRQDCLESLEATSSGRETGGEGLGEEGGSSLGKEEAKRLAGRLAELESATDSCASALSHLQQSRLPTIQDEIRHAIQEEGRRVLQIAEKSSSEKCELLLSDKLAGQLALKSDLTLAKLEQDKAIADIFDRVEKKVDEAKLEEVVTAAAASAAASAAAGERGSSSCSSSSSTTIPKEQYERDFAELRASLLAEHRMRAAVEEGPSTPELVQRLENHVDLCEKRETLLDARVTSLKSELLEEAAARLEGESGVKAHVDRILDRVDGICGDVREEALRAVGESEVRTRNDLDCGIAEEKHERSAAILKILEDVDEALASHRRELEGECEEKIAAAMGGELEARVVGRIESLDACFTALRADVDVRIATAQEEQILSTSSRPSDGLASDVESQRQALSQLKQEFFKFQDEEVVKRFVELEKKICDGKAEFLEKLSEQGEILTTTTAGRCREQEEKVERAVDAIRQECAESMQEQARSWEERFGKIEERIGKLGAENERLKEERAGADACSRRLQDENTKLRDEVETLRERLTLMQTQLSNQEIALFDVREETISQLEAEVRKRPTQTDVAQLVSRQMQAGALNPNISLELMKIRKDQELLLKGLRWTENEIGHLKKALKPPTPTSDRTLLSSYGGTANVVMGQGVIGVGAAPKYIL